MLENFFKIKEHGSDFKTEIIAGITTFLAMTYILAVNPIILADGLISGAIVGIVSSFAMFTVFTLSIYLVLGLFGAFIGKVLQSNFSS